ncbi:sensor N-terminal transmembrane domain-containing protein [Thioclava sp. FR2]|uniref:sensor N-terminal transmembrane domain-containing protein n=1 Tax=Thioclava sp. FR2 TaxID=3445780 RepID=UPI003EB7E432
MTTMPQIGGADSQKTQGSGLILGEDWVSSKGQSDHAERAAIGRRGLVSLKRSPLARKIIVFNLMALVVLVAGVLFLNPFRDSLVTQREQGFVTEARLLSGVVEARLSAPQTATTNKVLDRVSISPGAKAIVFNPSGVIVDEIASPASGQAEKDRSTVITGFLNFLWSKASQLFSSDGAQGGPVDAETLARALFERALRGETVVNLGNGPSGGALFSVATPVVRDGAVLGVVALISAEGEIDALVRNEREQILQMFLLALMVSIGLSLVLASTIANPLSDLAAAAEIGQDPETRKMQPGRVRIPDLTARPDEIGRLSVALRGMVAALYDRIDANEQFAADVAHEIKNPLASLRSAVASMHVAKRDDQRIRLLEVIDHDVRRLDRLVSDISNASRLDSELVKEQEEEFNLTKTLTNLCEYLGQQASEKGVELITDFPTDPIRINGLEARLAQVFVNLITNAVSFCEDGDAVRVWTRKRDNRVLVVVEDTGPGIPEQALTKIFKRFYSERPKNDFGNNSGLGLSISKQIIEAHGGVIWAENIRPTNADATSEPLGARFVVGLPV